MKINFGLLGLAAAQSGDDRWEDTSYDYDSGTDRWSNENQYSLDEANAGITFGVMARVTKQQEAADFQKALKLSCWNSNMIRDMNNDNKFSVYFNDQVEYKRFQPGINGAGQVGGTVDTAAGRDDLSWLYAVGDLRTGMNHQYGFEHNGSDPYYKTSSDTDANRMGLGTGTGAANPRNNNRLRQVDEVHYDHGYTAGDTDTANTTWDAGKTKVTSDHGIRADNLYHSVRPDQKFTFRKWGYQSDNVERAASGGYNEDTVVYHFGHHDNKDNSANRPNMRYAAMNTPVDELSTASGDRENVNMIAHEFDFYGFKDDWRYSLRMGGCLYEAARWVYDESSFHRTGRLTYTDDTLFMNDPFNPRDGTDIFGAHQFSTPVATANSGNAAELMEGAGGHDTIFNESATASWSNAGSTNTSNGAYTHGDCLGGGDTCQNMNVATPSSGGVFADVHWVHVFNAHIFPLQDVGYYQYDQTLGLTNVNGNNDSITSRDGYGYNIYTAPGTGQHVVMRDVWGRAGVATYDNDGGNNTVPGNANTNLSIDADEFHSQYGTINIGNTNENGGQGSYTNSQRPNNDGNDFYPILTKTRRKIEDFNVVMANPTYEGHGFLNFVATYHDHTENFNDSNDGGANASGYWIRQVGKRFLSTIGGLTTASNEQRLVCRAVKDGIDSYRMNNLMPQNIGSNTTSGYKHPGTATTLGHDDPFLAPLGPGPAGNYGNGQRCGAAMYENFGDWFLRPAQTYSAYNNFTNVSGTGVTAAATGWNTAACTADSDSLCLEGMESYNYWAFILSEGYHPIYASVDDPDEATAHTYMSAHELWRNGSLHYDRRGSDGDASSAATLNRSNSSGRGFAISSFPHNELGKDFRFNIRTLHNMGNGVAKQYYQIQRLTAGTGNEFSSSGSTSMTTLRTSNLRTTETVWSYYFYAVDTIKIAFPEFVARVNHCDRHSHRNDSHCVTNLTLNTENGNPDESGASDGVNKSSAYPGYKDAHPHRRLGFQDIIIDGVTMKKTDNQYDSRVTTATRTDTSNAAGTAGAGNWHKQYHNARGLRGDDHTRATLHYLDTEFRNEDLSLDEGNSATPMCGTDHSTINMSTNILFYGVSTDTPGNAGGVGKFQGYTDTYQPLKPCASWCAIDAFGTDVVHGDGVDNSKQTVSGTTVTGTNSVVATGTTHSRYGGICGRVLRIDGLLQTYDELHNRQYGTIQEIWVQLQYAYQESLDDSNRTTSGATCTKNAAGNSCEGGGVRKVQSPFPNVFFSAPEVVDIRGFCPSSNMKCRGYMSDQHQPYGGSRNHVERVHWNASATRSTDQIYAFGANQLGTSGTGPKQTGNDWSMDRDFRGDSKWPWNYHSFTAAGGVNYGGDPASAGTAGTTYSGRDLNHDIYDKTHDPTTGDPIYTGTMGKK